LFRGKHHNPGLFRSTPHSIVILPEISSYPNSTFHRTFLILSASITHNIIHTILTKMTDPTRGTKRKRNSNTNNASLPKLPKQPKQQKQKKQQTQPAQQAQPTQPTQQPEAYYGNQTGGKPEPFGKPLFHAEKRQQLCETLPWYRAYQSGPYTNGGIAYGILCDKEVGERDYFGDQVIITRV
jgi:hypothetical protein